MNFSNLSSESGFSRSVTPQHKFSVYDENWGVQAQPSQESHYESIIAKLTAEVNLKDQEIAELRLNNEVLIAAMYQTSTPMPVGEPDAVEISHRIVRRLSKLRSENAKLMLKADGSYAAQLEAELSNLKRELVQLRGGRQV